MVTCLSKCEVGQKRPAKMRIEGLQNHKRELFGPQRTVLDLVHDKAVDAPRPGFGSNEVFFNPVGPTKSTQVSLRLGTFAAPPAWYRDRGLPAYTSEMQFTILAETVFTVMIQRADEETSAITLIFHDDLVYHGHPIV